MICGMGASILANCGASLPNKKYLNDDMTINIRVDSAVVHDTILPVPSVLPWESARVLGVESGAHVAAVVGIVALVLLGGVLVMRNRLDRSRSAEREGASTEEAVMTDSERVRQLIRQNGGRMKQSAIVDSVDWSKAKVSRLLTDLEEEGEITKLRLGRENLVCLSGHEPPASKSSEGSGGS